MNASTPPSPPSPPTPVQNRPSQSLPPTCRRCWVRTSHRAGGHARPCGSAWRPLPPLLEAAITGRRRKRSSAAPVYVTEAVRKGNLTLTVAANGTIVPTRVVNIGSELSGTVKRVLVDVNDVVKKGQVLVELDTAKLDDQVLRSRAALAATQAQLAQATATVRESRGNLARFEEVSRLSGGKVPSATELDSARAALDRAVAGEASARANVEEARATVSTDETNLSKASIRSPIDGVVLTRTVDPGNAVAASLQAVTLVHRCRGPGQAAPGSQRGRGRRGRGEGRAESQLHRQRLPVAALPGQNYARGLRLDQDRQRGHLHHLARSEQHRPEPAPGHDGSVHHRRHRAQRRAAGAQHRAALYSGGRLLPQHQPRAAAWCPN